VIKMYDILIENASVIDGTGSPPFEADLAITGQKIEDVGQLNGADAALIIDAKGYAVAPGFIDMHSHADFSLPIHPTADSLVHQGITTVVVGQCGMSPAPLLEESRAQVISAISGLFGDLTKSIPWNEWASLGDYLNFLTHQGCSLNVIPLVGQGIIRAAVMGFGEGRADAQQMAQMKDLVIRAMQQGAIGLSTGLIYPPGSFTSTEELIELTKVVGDRNGFYFSHIRGEGGTLLEAVEEAIRVGRETGASVQISHFKAARQSNWGKSEKALDLIRQAQSTGLDITADLYPYRAGSTSLATLLPEWTHIGGPAKILERLKNPDTQAKMTADMQSGGFAFGFEWQDILITSSPRNTEYEGRNISELAAQADKSPYDWLFGALLETELDMSMAVFGMSEENRQREVQFSGMMFGTDGVGMAVTGPMAKGVPHPRNYGAFPRVLGRFVRDLKVIELEEAIYRMTGRPAAKLRLNDRGLIKPGLAADLVLFDPAEVSDRATYDNPHQYADGIFHVIVNGNLIVHQATHTGARPGRILKID
jgi:N-acyl-D-aspartate/D-glutamate deacylase